MRPDLYTKFQTDGYLVIEDFLNNEEVSKLRKAGVSLAENIPPGEQKAVFSTNQTNQYQTSYFIESGDKVRYFYETEALTENGDLKVEPASALNKVGHALHLLHPDFKEVSFSLKVQELCRLLHLEDPVIVQSMYIYKNPKIGGEVIPHQDSTYLYTEPNTLVGLWFPLDDCTVENGCLWFIPGSHTSETHRRMVRSDDPNSETKLVFDRPPVTYPSSSFNPCPVPKGKMSLPTSEGYHQMDNNMNEVQRPLIRKKSSRSRFGLVQKTHSDMMARPESNSEILNALSIEEREFIQNIYRGRNQSVEELRRNEGTSRSVPEF